MKQLTTTIRPLGTALLLLCLACSPGQEQAPRPPVVPGSDDRIERATPPADDPSPYAFEAPEASLPLPEDLREISGLTVLEDGRLAAVQDEAGILFLLNPETGAVDARVPFDRAGDYEAIERVGDTLFVLQSDGRLTALTGREQEAPNVRHYDTGLTAKNDPEGLAYDAAGRRLLIAAKEDPGKGIDNDLKAVYAFDLATGTRSAAPAFTLDLTVLRERLGFEKKRSFKPSALAVHPASGDLFVLSSVAKAVAVLDARGALRHAWALPPEIFEQPEGLAFLPDGDLAISSEGVDRPAMLHRIALRGSF
jgi:uncharacterized protein YjiK